MPGLAVIFAFAIAGYGAGWYARGPRRQAEAIPSEASDAIAAALAACRDAVAEPAGPHEPHVREAMARVEAIDAALEERLGTENPAYRRFDRAVNALASVAHQIRCGARGEGLSAALAGISADLDALGA